jgi:hypothetical protein
VTDFGKRVQSQWTGNTLKDVYAINVADGSKKLVIKDLNGFLSPQYISPIGKYIMWYDRQAKNYFSWDGKETRNITSKIKVALYDEENDTPDLPTPYGVMKWQQSDSSVFIYDRYDVWKVDPTGKLNPDMLTNGRKEKIVYRYVNVDPEERFIKDYKKLVYRLFNETTKESQLSNQFLGMSTFGEKDKRSKRYWSEVSIGNVLKAKNSNIWIFTLENFKESPNLFSNFLMDTTGVYDYPSIAQSYPTYITKPLQLSSINPQQNNYNWGIAELFKWKAYNGKKPKVSFTNRKILIQRKNIH